MLHPVLGRSFEGRSGTCSKCGHTIDEDHVPLMLIGGGESGLCWTYCGGCEGPTLALMKRSMKSKALEAQMEDAGEDRDTEH